MNESINKVILLGNLGEDPKIKYYDDHRCITRFRMATNEKLQKSSGEDYVHTEWHTVVIKNSKLAKKTHQRLSKGDRVLVEGKIRTRLRGTEDHKTKTTEILCLHLEFILIRNQKLEQIDDNEEKEPNYNQFSNEEIDKLSVDLFKEDTSIN